MQSVVDTIYKYCSLYITVKQFYSTIINFKLFYVIITGLLTISQYLNIPNLVLVSVHSDGDPPFSVAS